MRMLSMKAWAKKRSRGWRHFVLITGILEVALPTMVLGLLFAWWWSYHSGLIDQMPGLRQRLLFGSLVGVFLAAPILGVVWGAVVWSFNEWLYGRYIAGSGAGA
jgi:hypothetical protein